MADRQMETYMTKAISKFVLTVVFTAAFAGLCASSAVAQDKPDYQKHIDWARHNQGDVDCPQFYGNDLECLAFGHRECVMTKAIIAAKNGYDAFAFSQTLLTQCHDPNGSLQTLLWAGQQAVADYLRTLN